MKLLFLLSFLAVLATTILAWDPEDHEIFDLVSAVEASEGKGTTFYSWLKIPHTSTTAEIAKAYRKLSMQLHPDKNPDDQKVAERFARLGVVSTILRNAESRKRYDFFYKNGVPKWRGTGYYYARFRPGLGSVFVFLALVTSGVQYLIQGMNYRRDLERVERLIAEARVAAWGPKLIPTESSRKVKVPLSGSQRYDEDGRPLGSSGRTVDMVVKGQEVFILDGGEMHLLDASAAIPASILRLWPVAIAFSLFDSVVRRFKAPSNTDDYDDEKLSQGEVEEASSVSDGPGSGTVTPSRAPASKVGGKRKKASKQR